MKKTQRIRSPRGIRHTHTTAPAHTLVYTTGATARYLERNGTPVSNKTHSVFFEAPDGRMIKKGDYPHVDAVLVEMDIKLRNPGIKTQCHPRPSGVQIQPLPRRRNHQPVAA